MNVTVVNEAGCGCGDVECLHLVTGYPWCRPCDEHHRPPECAIDEQGRPLAPCSHPWEVDPCTSD